MARTNFDPWWKPKATNLLAILYAGMLVTELRFGKALFLLVPSVVTIFGIGSFGHVINDWQDVDADSSAGKLNRLAHLPDWKRRGLLLSTLVIALLPWVVLPSDRLSAALLLLEFALLLAYAVPPIRLKERRIWPVFVDAAYAYAVPAVLAAHTVFLAAARPSDPALLGSLALWQLAFGARHYLNHIAMDRRNDLATRTHTLATQNGNEFVYALVQRVVLPVELVSFLGFLILLSTQHPLLLISVASLFLLSSSLHLFLAVGRRYPLVTHRFSKTNVDWLYQDGFSFVVLFFLVIADWRFCLLLAAHVFLFHTRALVRLKFVVAELTPPALLVRGGLSHFTNDGNAHGRGPDSQPPGNRMQDGDGSSIMAGSSNIAIVNINKGKYTETFVQGLIPALRYNVYYLYGGELPKFDAEDRHFLSQLTSLHALAHFLESLFGLEPDYFLKNSIASYLQARGIQLVLAHFGPVGAEILPITKDLGIPLIVCFHGYDVFHKETLRLYAERYKTVFREADVIIGVSELMLKRLQDLGAPEDKLVHLPAYVNLELFPYMDHSRNAAAFVAVGRFAETKSPHLTILAFHRVAHLMPAATLTMIGKGGGGELFEACVILIKSLGLEDRVELKGVLSHEQVAIELRRARVFVQHSVTTPEQGDMEGKPVAVMEAMASGLPVIATHHSGIVELIEDRVTGLLVAEYDVQAMADAMLLLARDDELVRRIGQNASWRIHGDPLISDHIRILNGIIGNTIAGN